MQKLGPLFAKQDILSDFKLVTQNDQAFGNKANRLSEVIVVHKPKLISEKLRKLGEVIRNRRTTTIALGQPYRFNRHVYSI